MNARKWALALIIAVIFVVISSKLGQDDMSSDNPSDTDVKVAPYGSWASPLTAASIFEGEDIISELTVDGDYLYFIERKASANGRNVLMRLGEDRTVEQLTSSDFSVRSRVHEYGGRPYAVDGNDIYYSRFGDQRIYRRSNDGDPQALTDDGLRYMECSINHKHNLLICVREDHRGEGEAVNTLVSIDLGESNKETVLFEGTDFVDVPRVSPDQNSVAFVTWSHPNMPWDDTQLRILTFADDGSVAGVSQVPQAGNVSFKKPEFSPDGTLFFVADFENWWTLYRLDQDGNPTMVLDQEIELQSYGLESDTQAVVAYLKNGRAHLARVDVVSGHMTNIGDSFSTADDIAVASDGVYFRAATSSSTYSAYKLNGTSYEKVYEPSGLKVSADYLSEPEYFAFPTGTEEEAFGFFYPPKNAEFIGADDALPPLIVKVHGGPVGAATSKFDAAIQFWTSRGFAVFDVNHRGSTGYGRAFRKKLYPNWGIVDIEDAANGVKWLAAAGYINADKVAIRGGSAGGYTTLGAVAFRKEFRAGASYFGVSDLEVLARDTHKYESRYLDQLIGPYPQSKEIYEARSPINSIDRIRSPLLLLQGLDDEVVPPNQSQLIYEALVEKCIPTAYIAFEGEGHGFRRPENKIRALNSELDFYGQIFEFQPAGDIERVQLHKCDN